MKELFPGYYRPSQDDLKRLWNEGIFVFDTNVLLSLYSYPETVREVFISVFRKISTRTWIPYHVGLEFHRNKFARIKQSNQRVEKLLQTIRSTGDQLSSEVRSIELEKRNIGLTDIQARLTAVNEAHQALSEAVQLACNKLPLVSLDDSIGTELCKLLDSSIGSPPCDQAALDTLVADAQDRFDKRIPPGFEDANKGEETYRDRGITYYRKFGDLIIWRQLIAYAKENSSKSIVFVTGDKKKDWWWLDDGKTLGPLPELVQEITQAGGVELFWMYSADQFLEHAETFLQAKEVTPEAVEQVKELSNPRSPEKEERREWTDLDRILKQIEILDNRSFTKHNYDWLLNSPSSSDDTANTEIFRSKYERQFKFFRQELVERAVENWLQHTHSNGEVLRTKGFPDFIVNQDGFLTGIEIKAMSQLNPRAFPPPVVNALLRGYVEVHEGRLNAFSIVLALTDEDADVINNETLREETRRRGAALLKKFPANNIIVGAFNGDQFFPILFVAAPE